MLRRLFTLIFILSLAAAARAQQDVDFHMSAHLFPGKKIIKLKRDFYDPYLWVLSANNEVYRVNTLDYTIDDYTATFASYSNLQFIDIAGRSKDTVFLATHSPHVVQFESGNLTLLGTTNGIKDTVTSVGIDFSGDSGDLYTPPNGLLIGTTGGCLNYDVVTGEANIEDFNPPPTYSVIFEATYRRNSASGIDPQWTDGATGITYYGLGSFTSPTLYGAEAWTGAAYGTHLNTTFYAPSTFDYNSWLFNGMNIFWGTELGLFQSPWTRTYPGEVPYTDQYLNGIQVNKITDIYGLTAYGYPLVQGFNPGLVKDNLLIGTVRGLYFSSSILGSYITGTNFERKFSLFHFDDLGTIPVNDIYVNTTVTAYPVCENGVWLGTDDGVYFIKPDYGAYFPSAGLKAIGFQQPVISSDTLNVCQGSSAIAAINNEAYSGNSYQWYKDGSQINGQVKQSLNITAAGDYYVLLYDPCSGLHAQSNHLTVNVISSPVFTFNYPDKIQQCNNNPDTLQVTYNPGYHYQWYSNDTLNGDTSSSYIVTQSGKYKVAVSACTNSWVPSKEVEVDLVTLPNPQITADKQQYCAEDTAMLTVNTPVDPSYTINWYQDGNLLAADANLTTIKTTAGGNYTAVLSSTVASCTQTSAPLSIAFTPAPVFTFNYPAQLQYCAGTPVTLTVNGSNTYQYQWYFNDAPVAGSTATSISVTQSGKYKVEVSACPGSWVSSKEVQVQLPALKTPVITLDKPQYCTGDMATISENIPTDPSYSINWLVDGTPVPGTGNETSFVTTISGKYVAVIVNSTQNTDGTWCTQISAPVTLAFDPPPTVSITQTVNTTLCMGQTVTLTAQHSAGTVRWSTGETTDQIAVTQAGNYTATVTSAGGCQADASISVSFLPNPTFNLRDTTICTYKQQSVTLTAPAGFSAYSWNNGASTQTAFTVSQPGTVSLTVTDVNGCQATQQIHVKEQCGAVFIPNTFTPNGDGINDTWDIQGLDASATVKVFTRWGTEVYQSIGYSNPWNGEYNGKMLPAGVYYYIITAKSGSQKFSGSLTIIY